MVFGSLFGSPSGKFGSFVTGLTQKLGNIYSKAKEIPAVQAQLEKYKIPQFIETGKQALETGKGIYSGLQQLGQLGKQAKGYIPAF